VKARFGRASEQVKRSTGDAASLCCTASKEGHESAIVAQSRLLRFTSPAGRKMGDITEIRRSDVDRGAEKRWREAAKLRG
jgi:hypothetical protein